MSLSIDNNKEVLKAIIEQISKITDNDANKVSKVINRHKLKPYEKVTKTSLLEAYYSLKTDGLIVIDAEQENTFLRNCRVKNVRTVSGVTPVTVMTKPYPCPGNCIYCPNEKGVPKSYIANEPGAQRAVSNGFDPYLQTYNRLVAYKKIGHATDKVELIIIGGTWSYYPKAYRTWFVKRCFDAMNDFSIATSFELKNIKYGGLEKTHPEELEKTLTVNETTKTRCVGLSVETRPDFINSEELVFLRQLGVTKVQLGVQSFEFCLLYTSEAETVRS